MKRYSSPKITSTKNFHQNGLNVSYDDLDACSPLSGSTTTSRYGRMRKPKVSEDFCNIDVLFNDVPPPSKRSSTPSIRAYLTSKIDAKTQPNQKPVITTTSNAFTSMGKKEKISPLKNITSSSLYRSAVNSENTVGSTKIDNILMPDPHDIDVNDVLKIVANSTPKLKTLISAPKSQVKTYQNKRKSYHYRSEVVESFGLPDSPIVEKKYDTFAIDAPLDMSFTSNTDVCLDDRLFPVYDTIWDPELDDLIFVDEKAPTIKIEEREDFIKTEIKDEPDDSPTPATTIASRKSDNLINIEDAEVIFMDDLKKKQIFSGIRNKTSPINRKPTPLKKTILQFDKESSNAELPKRNIEYLNIQDAEIIFINDKDANKIDLTGFQPTNIQMIDDDDLKVLDDGGILIEPKKEEDIENDDIVTTEDEKIEIKDEFEIDSASLTLKSKEIVTLDQDIKGDELTAVKSEDLLDGVIGTRTVADISTEENAAVHEIEDIDSVMVIEDVTNSKVQISNKNILNIEQKKQIEVANKVQLPNNSIQLLQNTLNIKLTKPVIKTNFVRKMYKKYDQPKENVTIQGLKDQELKSPQRLKASETLATAQQVNISQELKTPQKQNFASNVDISSRNSTNVTMNDTDTQQKSAIAETNSPEGARSRSRKTKHEVRALSDEFKFCHEIAVQKASKKILQEIDDILVEDELIEKPKPKKNEKTKTVKNESGPENISPEEEKESEDEKEEVPLIDPNDPEFKVYKYNHRKFMISSKKKKKSIKKKVGRPPKKIANDRQVKKKLANKIKEELDEVDVKMEMYLDEKDGSIREVPLKTEGKMTNKPETMEDFSAEISDDCYMPEEGLMKKKKALSKVKMFNSIKSKRKISNKKQVLKKRGRPKKLRPAVISVEEVVKPKETNAVEGQEAVLVPEVVQNATEAKDAVDGAAPTDTNLPESSTSEATPSLEITGVISSSVEKTKFKVGDLCWGRVGCYPFWPCLVTSDPEKGQYYKLHATGRRLMLSYHVRFFGDNGRRSWIYCQNMLPFKSGNDLQELIDSLSQIEEPDKVTKEKLYTLKVTATKPTKWKIAIEEAESLRDANVEQRLDFFQNFNRKRKAKSPIPEQRKRKKLNDDGDGNFKVNISKIDLDTSDDYRRHTRSVSLPSTKIGTPLGVSNKDARKSLAVPAQKPSKLAVEPKMEKSKQRKERDYAKDPSFQAYHRNNIQKMRREHPDMKDFALETMLHKLWDALDPEAKRNYNKGYNGDSDCVPSDTDSSVKEVPKTARSKSNPINIDKLIANMKKYSLFKGVPKEKVCQLCEKGANVLKCKGSCGGFFHLKCMEEKIKADFMTVSDTSLTSVDNIASTDTEDEGTAMALEEKPKIVFETQIDEKLEEAMQNIKNETKYADSTTTATDVDTSFSDLEDATSLLAIKIEDNKPEVSSENAAILPEPPTAASPSPYLLPPPPPASRKILKHVTGDADDDSDAESNNGSASGAGAAIVTNTGNNSKIVQNQDFICKQCADGIIPLCFICGKATSKDGNSAREKCNLNFCRKYYHVDCLRSEWPQTVWHHSKVQFQEDLFTCPVHFCHTCGSDDPRAATSRCSSDKVVKCLYCPTTYHNRTYCIPAGTEILSMNQIVCVKHYLSKTRNKNAKRIKNVNASWCFICAEGGSLICCETCPSSFHAECLKINPPEDIFICEDCESGRFPLYNDIVWVKLGAYRWWPAIILFPNEVPENVKCIRHAPGDFCVKFFGTYDHYWINRGRVFSYQEGDSGNTSSKKKQVDGVFMKAIAEAADASKIIKKEKDSRLEELRSNLKPPSYIKINKNKPVGNVKLCDGDTSNTTPCECDPNSKNPCGPDSDCLNRLLLTECDPMVCPAGTRCNNQRFEKRQYPPLQPYKTEGRGWGLKVLSLVKKGDFIIEYVGEMIDDAEYQRRLKKMHENKDENYYFLTIDNTRMLDAGPKGNVARFMNHSCRPNCITQKWTVNGGTRVGLFAKEDIPPNTELTFNYNLQSTGEDKKECKCGAPNCSGFIGSKPLDEDHSKKNLIKMKKIKKKKLSEKADKMKDKRSSKKDEIKCFKCGKGGEIGTCNNKICSRVFHLDCVGLEIWPDGKWTCPSHSCNICSKRTTRCCTKCINSYCPSHSESNIRYDKATASFVCSKHDKKEKNANKASKLKQTLANDLVNIKEESSDIETLSVNNSSKTTNQNNTKMSTSEAHNVGPIEENKIDGNHNTTLENSTNEEKIKPGIVKVTLSDEEEDLSKNIICKVETTESFTDETKQKSKNRRKTVNKNNDNIDDADKSKSHRKTLTERVNVKTEFEENTGTKTPVNITSDVNDELFAEVKPIDEIKSDETVQQKDHCEIELCKQTMAENSDEKQSKIHRKNFANKPIEIEDDTSNSDAENKIKNINEEEQSNGHLRESLQNNETGDDSSSNKSTNDVIENDNVEEDIEKYECSKTPGSRRKTNINNSNEKSKRKKTIVSKPSAKSDSNDTLNNEKIKISKKSLGGEKHKTGKKFADKKEKFKFDKTLENDLGTIDQCGVESINTEKYVKNKVSKNHRKSVINKNKDLIKKEVNPKKRKKINANKLNENSKTDSLIGDTAITSPNENKKTIGDHSISTSILNCKKITNERNSENFEIREKSKIRRKSMASKTSDKLKGNIKLMSDEQNIHEKSKKDLKCIKKTIGKDEDEICNNKIDTDEKSNSHRKTIIDRYSVKSENEKKTISRKKSNLHSVDENSGSNKIKNATKSIDLTTNEISNAKKKINNRKKTIKNKDNENYESNKLINDPKVCVEKCEETKSNIGKKSICEVSLINSPEEEAKVKERVKNAIGKLKEKSKNTSNQRKSVTDKESEKSMGEEQEIIKKEVKEQIIKEKVKNRRKTIMEKESINQLMDEKKITSSGKSTTSMDGDEECEKPADEEIVKKVLRSGNRFSQRTEISDEEEMKTTSKVKNSENRKTPEISKKRKFDEDKEVANITCNALERIRGERITRSSSRTPIKEVLNKIVKEPAVSDVIVLDDNTDDEKVKSKDEIKKNATDKKPEKTPVISLVKAVTPITSTPKSGKKFTDHKTLSVSKKARKAASAEKTKTKTSSRTSSSSSTNSKETAQQPSADVILIDDTSNSSSCNSLFKHSASSENSDSSLSNDEKNHFMKSLNIIEKSSINHKRRSSRLSISTAAAERERDFIEERRRSHNITCSVSVVIKKDENIEKQIEKEISSSPNVSMDEPTSTPMVTETKTTAKTENPDKEKHSTATISTKPSSNTFRKMPSIKMVNFKTKKSKQVLAKKILNKTKKTIAMKEAAASLNRINGALSETKLNGALKKASSKTNNKPSVKKTVSPPKKLKKTKTITTTTSDAGGPPKKKIRLEDKNSDKK